MILLRRVLSWAWMLPTVGYFGLIIVWLGKTASRWAAADTHTNCFFYVMHLYWTQGGYIVFVPSPHGGWWGHFRHTFDFVTFTEYVPRAETERRWAWVVRYLRFPPLTFPGKVVTRVSFAHLHGPAGLPLDARPLDGPRDLLLGHPRVRTG